MLGASAGIVLGLIEARCLRLADFPLPPSIWFLAPLLTSVAFGLLGLLAGFLASLPRSRMLGMGIIAGLAGLTGEYLAFVLRFSRSIIAFQHFLTPTILFAGFSAWTVAALWATRKPGSPLGFLADAPQRVWAGVVFASIATLAAALGISRLPDHLVESTTRAAGKTQSPNIVLIVLDTARADHFSSYGYFRNTTPNVDQFAERGVLFENAISASSWTLPSMFSVFTSLLPHQHGAGTYRAIEPRTLAEILREDGYETAGFNANPYYGIISRGLGRGFETYTDSTRSLGFSLDLTRIGRDFIESYSEEWFHRSRFNQFTAHQLNGEVYRWFDHRSDRPFFLFLNYNDAHEPYEVPAPYSHRYGTISENAKRMVFTSETCRFYLPPGEREGVIAAYDNSLSYIDSQIGELLAFLKRAPEWSNTYVIITADHGEGFGEHDDTYSHGLNLYREVLHVPLIMAGPGIPARVRVTDIAKTQRIFGTVLGWSGMKGEVLRRASLARLMEPRLRARNARGTHSLGSLGEPSLAGPPRRDQHHHTGVAAYLPPRFWEQPALSLAHRPFGTTERRRVAGKSSSCGPPEGNSPLDSGKVLPALARPRLPGGAFRARLFAGLRGPQIDSVASRRTTPSPGSWRSANPLSPEPRDPRVQQQS